MRDQSSEKPAALEVAARTSVDQIQTTAMWSQAFMGDIALTANFYLQVDPNRLSTSIFVGEFLRECDQKKVYSIETKTVVQNSVFKTAANRGKLIIKYGPGHHCQ